MAKTKTKTVYKIKWKNTLILFSSIIGIILLILTSSRASTFFKDKRTTEKNIEEIREKVKVTSIVDDELTKTIPPDSKLSKFDSYWDYIKLGLIDVDMASLKRINSDTIGYIEVKGTDYSYPVLEYKNGKYNTHSFDKKENSFGWIYLDEKNDYETINTNTIIHGNKVYANLLSSKLKVLYDKSWQEDDNNFILKYTTNYASGLYQIISVYKTKDNSHLKTSFKDDEDLQKFIASSIEKSEIKFKTDAKTTDKFLTLTTDSNGKDIVVLAKLIKIRETN